MADKPKIKIQKNGPYVVTGNVPLNKLVIKVGKDGNPDRYEEVEKYPAKEEYLLCRCGKTKTPPFCDQSHLTNGFDGTETVGDVKYKDLAKKMEGPTVDLTDATEYCALAKFCDRGKGTWQAVLDSNNPEDRKLAVQTSCDCPSGRLVALEKDGTPIEPDFPPSISIIEDDNAHLSGPIWVKGGIEIEGSDGLIYEKRNRVTLCRCGKSNNKPYCTGNHLDANFNDGDKSIKK